MSIYNERCTIVANQDGSIKTVFVDQLEVSESGREFNAGQKTIGEPELEQFLGELLSTTVAERNEISSQLTAVTAQLTTITTERDSLVTQLAELQTQNDTLTQQNAAIEARMAALLAAIPFDPRVIDATAFVARIQPGELLTLFSSPDATTQQITAMIQAYKTNDWPILLDSPELQQAVGYLVQTAAITEQRAAELRRDATQAEAYSAG